MRRQLLIFEGCIVFLRADLAFRHTSLGYGEDRKEPCFNPSPVARRKGGQDLNAVNVDRMHHPAPGEGEGKVVRYLTEAGQEKRARFDVPVGSPTKFPKPFAPRPAKPGEHDALASSLSVGRLADGDAVKIRKPSRLPVDRSRKQVAGDAATLHKGCVAIGGADPRQGGGIQGRNSLRARCHFLPVVASVRLGGLKLGFLAGTSGNPPKLAKLSNLPVGFAGDA